MAKDRKKNDYAGCSFVWRWKGRRPTAVRHMVEERAFKSFGLDVDVMKNVWTGSTPAGSPENEIFPRIPREDICCADTVGWTAFQTGVVDFLGSRKLNIHWVDTYFPFKKTVHGFDFAKLVGVYGPDDRAKGLDDANFLPGDYFIYVRVMDWTIGGNHKVPPAQRIADGLAGTEEKVATVGDHINLWLGPFEAFDGSDSLGTFDQINGSYGTNNGNEYVWPVDRRPYWKWEWDNGTYVVHCRFKAIEQLFKELVGPPLRPPPRAGKSSSVTADLDAFWQATRDAQAPYPVGLHLGWHQGVHAKMPDKASDADKVDAVYAMAPGQVVAVRCASPGLAEGDASFVLLKHQLVKATKRVVDPTDPPSGAAADALQPFFSLSMHLAPLSRFLGPKADGGAVPPLLPEAPTWLRGLWPRPVPAGAIPAATPQVLLAPQDGDPDKGWVSLGASPKHLVQQPVSLAGLTRVSAGGVDYYLVPAPGDPTTSESAKLAATWTGRPAKPVTQNTLALYNPRTQKVYKTQLTLDGWAHLAVTQSDDGSQHLVVENVDGDEYAHVDQYLHPALRRTGRANDFTTASAPVDGRSDVPDDVLVLPPAASRGDAWDVYLSTTVTNGKVSVQGPGATLRFADIVDADAETVRKQGEPDDKTTHTTLGVRDPMVPTGDAAAGTTTGFYWLDLVPCVKLSKSSQDIEASLNGDQARIRRAATDRLKKGTTRLLGIVASSKDGSPWTVDSESFAVSGQSSTAANALYTTLQARSAGFGVDPKDKNALAPDGAASASLRAVDVCPGPTKGTTNVAVEIAFAVNAKDVDQANRQALQDAKKDADARKALIDDLTAGKIVDLRARVPAPVLVAREPIGAFGTIVGAPGEKGTQQGVHLEMFAGSPIGVDGSPSLGDKKLTPVAGSPWLALKDTSADDLLSSKAARMIVRELVTRQGAGFKNAGLEQLPPADDAAPWPAPSRDEWQTFCDAHERILARVVSVHPSEWALDWPESASKDGSTQKFQTAGMGSSVKDVHASLAWTTGPGAFQFAADDGIADPTAIVYHHPARVIEMLRTAIEVSVSSATAGAAAKATVTFTPTGEAAIKLALLDGVGTFGALVPTSEATDVAAAIAGTVDVQFAGGSPKPLTFPGVQIVRGATTQISVVAPWVEAVAQWSGGPKVYAVDYKEAPPYAADARTLCFLADGGAYAGPDGYGRAHLVAKAHYNLQPPTLQVADLPASGPFSIDPATIKRTVSPVTKQIPGEPTAQIPGVATLEFDVVAHTKAAATATVSVSVSGGELDSQTLAWTLCAREIDKAVVGKGRAGDVAQTQLYLALILANDGLPCYRADDAATKQAAIDGTYNEALRMALFRFVYSYVDSPAWKAAKVTDLKVGDGKTPATATLPAAQIAADAALIVHGDPAPQPAKDAHDARTKPSGGPRAQSVEWLVIDAALTSCIVGAFQAGAAVPVAELTTRVELPTFPPPAPDGPVVDAPGFVDLQTRGMYWPDYHVIATLKGDVSQGVKADGAIDVTLPDGAPFSLAAKGGAGSQTVSTTAGALASGFELEIAPVAGMQWTGKDAPQLRAVWRGGRNWQISQRHLPQPRDFFQKWDKDQRGWDVFLVQYCLSQATHRPDASGVAPARGFYPKTPAPKTPAKKGKDATSAPPPATAHADGIWTADWVKVLKDYAAHWGVQGTSDAVVHALLSQVLKNVPPG
ncbi:MAG TPA: hypothetical protein VGL81_02355 [Polyangiaceae bacterium]|jgi:hypothetical protein